MKLLNYKSLLIILLFLLFFPATVYSSSKRELYSNFFKRDVDDIIQSMSLKEKIGQILMFGFKGTDLDKDYRKWIADGELGNIKIFLRNVESKLQILDLITEISIYNDNTRLGIPPFIATDLEGGMVNHIRYKGIKLSPSAALISASKDYALARLADRLIANNLLSCGVNMNFAPCFDVLTNPQNRVIDTRSYSSNPEIVYDMAQIFINEHKKLGIITVPKHFPGHGMSSFDSHTKIGSVDLDLNELLKVHIFPYLNAIGDNIIDACMVSNIIYSAVDKNLPASLSPKVVNGLLRNYLGFNGLVVTDDLEMEGAEGVANGPINAFMMSFNAGNDILLFAHSKDVHKKLINKIPSLFEKGILNQRRLDEKVRRILLLKKKYLKNFYEIKEVRGENEKLLNVTEKLVEEKIDEGITLFINKTGKSTKIFFDDINAKNVKGLIVSPSNTFTSISNKYLPGWKVVNAWAPYKKYGNKKEFNNLIKNVKNYEFAVIGFSNEKHGIWLKIFDKYKIPYVLFIIDHPLLAINVMNNAQIAVTSYGSFATSVDALFRRVFEIGDFNGVFPYNFKK